jgi:hypothetical protein
MRVIVTALVFLGLTAPSSAVSGAGPGAASCLKFALDYTRNPPLEEQYFTWAQGYMSAIVMMAPGGVDDALDLLPTSYPKESQMVCPILTLFGSFTVTSAARLSIDPDAEEPSFLAAVQQPLEPVSLAVICSGVTSSSASSLDKSNLFLPSNPVQFHSVRSYRLVPLRVPAYS